MSNLERAVIVVAMACAMMGGCLLQHYNNMGEFEVADSKARYLKTVNGDAQREIERLRAELDAVNDQLDTVIAECGGDK